VHMAVRGPGAEGGRAAPEIAEIAAFRWGTPAHHPLPILFANLARVGNAFVPNMCRDLGPSSAV